MKSIQHIKVMAITIVVALAFVVISCNEDDNSNKPVIENRDSLPVLKSQGVSTVISDSGVVRYKLISEDWFIYDRKKPKYWAFEKGLFIEKYDDQFNVDAFINCDTAYYYDDTGIRLWELRGRVVVKNIKGETFKTSLLYWDMGTHYIYSPAYMVIDGIEQDLEGYDFRSNEQMTEYMIHQSSGAFPLGDNGLNPPQPTSQDAERLEQQNDSTKQPENKVEKVIVKPLK